MDLKEIELTGGVPGSSSSKKEKSSPLHPKCPNSKVSSSSSPNEGIEGADS